MERIYKGRALDNQKVFGRDEINRRSFMKYLGEGLFLVAVEPDIKAIGRYLTDLLKTKPKEVIVGKDKRGLYAEYETHKFRFVDHTVEKDDGLDRILYALNNEFNPNLQIKGPRLAVLEDIFNTINFKGIESLREGEKKQLEYSNKKGITLSEKTLYHFPVYDLKK